MLTKLSFLVSLCYVSAVSQTTTNKRVIHPKGFDLNGPRRVGKTELLREIAEINPKNTLWLNGDDVVSEELLAERSVAAYSRLLEGKQLLIIDEAQYISDIMNKAKLMIDQIRPLHIILSGSASFDLVQSGAPLVGRPNIYQLHPLSQMEWKQKENSLQTRQNLDDRLVYGGYPELSQVQVKKRKINLPQRNRTIVFAQRYLTV
jgi:predicted AAA+ superfamily ATPase